MPSGDGVGTIGATHDGTFVIKGIGAAEINEEARVFGATHKGDGRADFNTEGLVGLGVGNARRSGGIAPLAALDVDGARGGSGTAGVRRGANASGIGHPSRGWQGSLVLSLLTMFVA
jgi:hypothetical protein